MRPTLHREAARRVHAPPTGPFDSAQSRPFDFAQGRRFDYAQGRLRRVPAFVRSITRQRAVAPARPAVDGPAQKRGAFESVPAPLRIYIAVACVAAAAVVGSALRSAAFAHPHAVIALMLIALLASLIKIEIPIAGHASTLTACHVIDLIALVMFGTDVAVIVAAWGAWTQCVFRSRVRNPSHQTIFSIASLALTLSAAGAVFGWVGGHPNGLVTAPAWDSVAAAATTSFLVNSALIAVAVALATSQRFFTVWFDFFFSSWPSYVIGAVLAGAIVDGIQHRSYWMAPLLAAALALSHRNHRTVVERINDSMTDLLTGLHNQRFVTGHVERELARAKRSGNTVAIAVLDIDNFKRINDRCGHAAGDAALRRVADALKGAVRDYDVCARYGGDEFVIVMTGCSGHDALRRIESARRNLTGSDAAIAKTTEPVCLSAGVAVFPDDGDRYEDLFAAADARMYRTKHTSTLHRSS